MKFTAAVGAALVITITILVVIANFTHEVTAQNKVRVAFFPNINHIVPIVGMAINGMLLIMVKIWIFQNHFLNNLKIFKNKCHG